MSTTLQSPEPWWRHWSAVGVAFAVGLTLGGWLFAKTQPRSLVDLTLCDGCWLPNQLTGLLASVAIQRVPGIIPGVVFETDKSIAIRYPLPEAEDHYVIFPKKDIKQISELGPADQAYIMDAYAVIAALVVQKRMKDYRVMTNGPGYQQINYLHFHLYGREEK